MRTTGTCCHNIVTFVYIVTQASCALEMTNVSKYRLDKWMTLGWCGEVFKGSRKLAKHHVTSSGTMPSQLLVEDGFLYATHMSWSRCS